MRKDRDQKRGGRTRAAETRLRLCGTDPEPPFPNGKEHQSKTAPEGAVTKVSACRYLAGLRLRPRPIFLASCERAAA